MTTTKDTKESRLEVLKKEWMDKLEEFGSPERNMAERRKTLKQLRELEQKMDKIHGITE